MLTLQNHNPSVKIHSSRLEKNLLKICRFLGLDGLELNLRLVSDREIRRYNKTFLGHDDATDVIAFPGLVLSRIRRYQKAAPETKKRYLRAWEKEGVLLGDLLVSTEMAKKQAREMKHSLIHETTILALHGLLHLLGYDDRTEKEEKKMWVETERLMELL